MLFNIISIHSFVTYQKTANSILRKHKFYAHKSLLHLEIFVTGTNILPTHL